MFSPHLSDDELLSQLTAKYRRTPPGNGLCEVCGAGLSVEQHEGGYPLPWACPASKVELAAAEAAGADAETIEAHRAHVSKSRWEDFRIVGDRRVMELIARYEALKQ